MRTEKLIKQNDPNCIPWIQKSGCFLRCAQAVAELKAEKALTSKQINDMYKWAKSYRHLNSRNDLTRSAPVMNRTMEVLGKPGRFIEVGTIKDGHIVWYPWVQNSPSYQQGDVFIQKIKQGGPQRVHFRIVDDYEQLLWDPHDPEIKNLGSIYTIVYRFVA